MADNITFFTGVKRDQPNQEPPEDKGSDGWVVSDVDGDKFRSWVNGIPRWTTDIDRATRYHRREDAEAVHAEDEDAWLIVPYK